MKKIFLVSGEPSGDQQGATLIHALKQVEPYTLFLGMGGDNMKNAGMEIIVHSADMALVGIVEVFFAWQRVLNAFIKLKARLYREKPDLVILIDYPGFNLLFAKIAKKAGCKVLYYIAPQLWAWGQFRIRSIQRYVDQVCVIFPFEVAFYRKYGVNAEFIGHPLVKAVHPTLSRESALAHFKLLDQSPLIALLPGSRKSEIGLLLPILLKTASLLKEKYPTAQFILPVAPYVDKTALTKEINTYASLNIKLIFNELYNALSLCDVAIAASGTVTLECGLLGLPTVLIYKLNPVTAWIAKKIATQTKLGICNILTDQTVMKEFFQKDATPEKIFLDVLALLENTDYKNQTKRKLKKVKEVLSDTQTTTLNDCIINLLNKVT